MGQKKRYSTNFVRNYIEENLRAHADANEKHHLSDDEARWFVEQLIQLEQAEALERIAKALEPTIILQEVQNG